MDSANWLARLSQNERLNFLLTNRIPRRYASLFMGWFSKIEQPIVRDVSLRVWRVFGGELQLEEAEHTQFRSLHDCFTRRLKPDARAIDRNPSNLVSPCDAVLGAHGRMLGTQVFQAKGFPYTLEDLLGSRELADRYRDGSFATLRLRSNMYHRFHAPCDGVVRRVVYISGDTWNVNPIALRRIERLYCKNERAVVEIERPESGRPMLLVAVAAILVASIRIHCLRTPLHLRYRGPNCFDCNWVVGKGDELGYFEHGSTIIAIAPPEFAMSPELVDGSKITMGQRLFKEL